MYFKFIARIRNNYLKSRQRQQRDNIDFGRATKIGILVYDKENRHHVSIKYLVDRLTLEGKSVRTLCMIDDPKKPPSYTFPHHLLTKKDLSWNGGFHSLEIRKFVLEDFDYLFVLTEQFRLPLETILIRCNAKCRVGFAKSGYDHVLELMLKLPKDAGFEAFISESLNYLPLFKHHAA